MFGEVEGTTELGWFARLRLSNLRRRVEQGGYADQAKAIEELSDSPQTRHLLIEKMSHHAQEVSGTAIARAVKIGHAMSPLLLAKLRTESVAYNRRPFIQALCTIANRDNLETFAEWTTESDLDVRVWAAAALGKIGDQRAIPYLAAMLRRKTEYSSDHRQPIYSLGAIGGDEAKRVLVEAYPSVHYTVQETARKVLREKFGVSV